MSSHKEFIYTEPIQSPSMRMTHGNSKTSEFKVVHQCDNILILAYCASRNDNVKAIRKALNVEIMVTLGT